MLVDASDGSGVLWDSRRPGKIVGRADELSLLHRVADRHDLAHPRAVFVGGEAGVGKTRLCDEFCDQRRGLGATVLKGGCFSLYDSYLAFGPLVEALRPLAQQMVTGDRLRVSEDILFRLAPLMPSLAVRGAIEAPLERDSGSQTVLFEAALHLFETLAADAPTVLFIEDAHWADRSTLDLIAFLARNVAKPGLMILATHRTDPPDETSPLAPFVRELVRTRRVVDIELAPLGRADVVAQLTQILGETPAPGTLEGIVRRAGGNPLFVEELARHPDEKLPTNLEDILRRRLSSLSSEEEEVLGWIAVAGKPVSYAFLHELTDLAEIELQSALRTAAAHKLIVDSAEPGAYDFRHPLLREVVYLGLLPAQKKAAHGRLAHVLHRQSRTHERRPSSTSAELAYHWFECEELEAAFRSSLDAADSAWAASAFAEAAVHLDRAAGVWDRIEEPVEAAGYDRSELGARAAEATYLMGDPAGAIERASSAVAALDASREPVRVALLFERLGQYYWDAGDGLAAVDTRSMAVEIMPRTPPSEALARVLAAHAQSFLLVGRYSEAAAACAAALPVARAAGARAEEGHIQNTYGVASTFVGAADSGLERLREASRIAQELRRPPDMMRAFHNMGGLLHVTGRLREAAQELERSIEMMRAVDSGGCNVMALQCAYAFVLTKLGRLEDVDAVVSHLEAPPFGQSALGLDLTRTEQAIVRGDLDRARELVARSASFVNGLEDLELVAEVATDKVSIAYWAGDLERAVQVFESALEKVRDAESPLEIARLLVAGARACAEASRASRVRRNPSDAAGLLAVARDAAVVARRLATSSGSDKAPFPEVFACKASVDAETARAAGHDAPNLWEEAVELWRRVDQPFESAYSLIRLAESHAGRGAHAAARKAILAAKATAEVLGANLLLRRIEIVARRCRTPLVRRPAEPRETPPPPTEQVLTARERDVACCLAEGLTDREIAERLTISKKTVEAHVAHIRKKLKATRWEAGTYAYDTGLLDPAAAL